MSLNQFIYEVDKVCRNDVSRNILVSERDYITQLNSLIRYPKGIFGSSNYKVHSQTLLGATEQKMGCDSIMIFKLTTGFKVGLFEAKYPKYKTVNPNINYKAWDKPNHFNKQLFKQTIWKAYYPQLIFWELFIDNGAPGVSRSPFIDNYGSSIILLEDILPFSKADKWNLKMLNDSLLSGGINFNTLIKRILDCKLGMLITESEDGQIKIKELSDLQTEQSLESTGTDNSIGINNNQDEIINDKFLEIPIFVGDNQSKINQFLKKYGLSSYHIYDLRNE